MNKNSNILILFINSHVAATLFTCLLPGSAFACSHNPTSATQTKIFSLPVKVGSESATASAAFVIRLLRLELLYGVQVHSRPHCVICHLYLGRSVGRMRPIW